MIQIAGLWNNTTVILGIWNYKYWMDEVNRLYFIVGFLLGVLLIGSIAVALGLIYHEWIKEDPKESE